MNRHRFAALGIVIGGAVGTTVVACGSSFTASDCEATRTCETAAGTGTTQAGAAPEASDSSSGGAGGDPASANGGKGNATGQGGNGDGDPGAAGAGDNAGAGGTETVETNPRPFVVTAVPQADATGVDPNGVVTLAFSEPLLPKTVTAESVKLLDGDTVVTGSVGYADSKVTFTPAEPLALLGTYTISVSTAVTDVEGAGLKSEYRSSFTVRDGTFTTVDAVTGNIYQPADTLPMSPKGDVLIAWNAWDDQTACPVNGQWFNRGKASTAPTVLSSASNDCRYIKAGGNASGVATVSWGSYPPANYLKQYRNGQWSTGDGALTSDNAIYPRVAVSPTGMSTFFYEFSNTTMKAYRVDANGKAAAKADTLSTDMGSIESPQVAFDAAGNGIAAFSVIRTDQYNAILVSQYTVSFGKWATGTILPGSLSSQADGQYYRGYPAVAMSPAGEAVVLWVKNDANEDRMLMANRFTPASGWSDPVRVGPSLTVKLIHDVPALVYDGQQFVAAFTGNDGQKNGTYVARLDAKSNAWSTPELRQGPHDLPPIVRMPRLASDPRGNLILVWGTGVAPTFKLNYQRFANGAWSATTALPGGTVNNESFETPFDRFDPLDLAVNSQGLAAIVWADKGAGSKFNVIRLASFY